jgi:hypothetical protein
MFNCNNNCCTTLYNKKLKTKISETGQSNINVKGRH